MSNPLTSLNFITEIENLGDEYWDQVEAANFPMTRLRYRNNYILDQLGLDQSQITNQHFENAFGKFEDRQPFLALRYHGYQFGTYNPFLGDGRGFLYGQLRDKEGNPQDLGTKGSGQTPWSRGGDGRLTLKGGIREIIASESLHRLGVKTSRTLSLIETGEKLWRSDEPSPTRSSVMVRLANTHLRFGTCERLLYLKKPQLLEKLLKHVINIYYPEIAIESKSQGTNQLTMQEIISFYATLVKRVASLAAEWMAAGFTHGVLNTDNMSLTGESFDYGPFAFIEQLDPSFTAAYFDQSGLYSFGRQPAICMQNLRLLQAPLSMLVPRNNLEECLDRFPTHYEVHFDYCILKRLGFVDSKNQINSTKYNLVTSTLSLISDWSINYGSFFESFSQSIINHGLPKTAEDMEPFSLNTPLPPREKWLSWRNIWWEYQNNLIQSSSEEKTKVIHRLHKWNLPQTPIRKVIEKIWNEIDKNDNWSQFNSFVNSTTDSRT